MNKLLLGVIFPILVSIPFIPAFANLANDDVFVIVHDEFGNELQNILATVPEDGRILVQAQVGVNIQLKILMDKDGNINIRYTNPNITPTDTITHFIWIEDLDWTDIDGEVVGVEVGNISLPFEAVTVEGFTVDSVHFRAEPFQVPADTTVDIDFLLIAEHFVIGGEIIPIESTSLILAGAQTFSWLIPVVLSVLGIGLFVVTRKSE